MKNKIFFIDQSLFLKKSLKQVTSHRGAIITFSTERNEKGATKVITSMSLFEDEIGALQQMFQRRFKQELQVTKNGTNWEFTIK